MFMLLGGNEKKVQKETAQSDKLARVKELFGSGRFPVVTTQVFEGRAIARVLDWSLPRLDLRGSFFRGCGNGPEERCAGHHRIF